jgi:5-oxopent-3-ene-1,2,5-tricarboxylate decarboxylase/2-hydroxyhepta-2,4-diene-1,7-dioate isomerase
MKTARVAFGGAVHEAAPHPAGLRLADGRVLGEDAVVWLAPFEIGTIVALGLNYADHARELAKELTVTPKDEPLVFLKTPGAVIGHRGFTRRPRDATFMHYECELAVVIAASGAPTQWATLPATPSATTMRSATIWKTGTGPIFA